MSAANEAQFLPTVRITIEHEAARVGIEFLGLASIEAAEAFGRWIAGNAALHSLFMAALDAAQPRPGDLDDEDARALVAAALQPQPQPPDPLDAIAPAGSLQGKSLRAVLALGEEGRRWLVWALAQRWPQDPGFREALDVICKREGIGRPGVGDVT